MSINDRILNGDVLIIDDVLPKSFYNMIRKTLHSEGFSWHVASETALVTDVSISGFDNGVSFAKNLYRFDGNGMYEETSKEASLLIAALMTATDAAQVMMNRLFRIRAGLIANTAHKYKFHYPHVDGTFENIAAVMYFSDCDAPIRIYNEVYDNSFDKLGSDRSDSTMICLDKKYNFKLTTKTEVPCRENRIVFFNGRAYHSSSIPTDTTQRIAINYNFI